VRTPAPASGVRWTQPVNVHARTKRSYPCGFVLNVEFKFHPNQKPVFPATNQHRHIHRPTFLGNSGIGIYHWPAQDHHGKYLYEVQVTDTAAITGNAANKVIPNINRFVRLDYGADLSQRGVLMRDIPQRVLDAEELLNDPRLNDEFRGYVDPGRGNGGADNLCAIVAGLPVSYFRDVTEGAAGTADYFPKTDVAISSPVGRQGDGKAIGGTEEPHMMPFSHRADYNPKNGTNFVHFNHADSAAWNKLKVSFLPARYDEEGDKCKNAFLETKVNDKVVFSGEIKSGTRRANRKLGQDPEEDVYVDNLGDMKIRLLGHWGSKVYYQNIKIRSVGSKEEE